MESEFPLLDFFGNLSKMDIWDCKIDLPDFETLPPIGLIHFVKLFCDILGHIFFVQYYSPGQRPSKKVGYKNKASPFDISIFAK